MLHLALAVMELELEPLPVSPAYLVFRRRMALIVFTYETYINVENHKNLVPLPKQLQKGKATPLQ